MTEYLKKHALQNNQNRPARTYGATRGSWVVGLATEGTKVEGMLVELERLLYGYNYAVFLRAYRIPFSTGTPAEEYIAQALGPAVVIGRAGPVSGPEVIAEVEQSLRYTGNGGCGPKPSALRSRRFKALVIGLSAELERAMTGAELVAQFWLREGHPAYPVFWDFAFVVAGPVGGMVFIGSSSD